ncbi:MAG: lactonase family protein [Aerococcus sp.]|nr:lactonase family protein [Aerococcus sp.]
METIYLGGYTRQTNKGLHTLTLDDNGQVVKTEQIIEETNPTYFVVSKDEQHLYTLSEKEGKAGVAHYAYQNGHFVEVGRVSFLTNNGCFISLDEDKQVLYTANYHEGKLAVIKIEANGELTLMNITSHVGHGPHENQDGPHCHYLAPTPDHRYLLACDLGTDAVTTYELTADYNLSEVANYHTELGSGARHLAFHPTLPIVYLISELTYTIDVLSYQDGQLERLNRVDTLEHVEGFNSSSAIRVSSDGNFVYVSNRGDNSLSVLKITQQGTELTLIQTIASGGDFPRDFNFNHDESLLIVGHQKSEVVTFFQRDAKTGTLTALPQTAPVSEIVCVQTI